LTDWFHLLMTALWVGGLVQVFAMIGPLRKEVSPAASSLGVFVGPFSNYARVAVVGLLLTGFYAAWLQVGTIEALLTTLYGQALLVKLILLLAPLGVAFF